MQAPMISSPLKQTNEIDWITPLKGYIRSNYGDDPERYSEECNALNRLRQDMRGAGKDSASGRDLLYRYYGQLELLDLRFPVDENHIKILFTWFDAFTIKQTSQHSLAYEKASIIFNISAVLSCHAANQNRHEETGLKTAYHSFQASAGMFTYINENFLHAPSTDLNHDTVKTLIGVMLAQAQEVFLEKQITDGKKVGLLAKLASQAAFLYVTAVEGVQEIVNKAIFERAWLQLSQVKSSHMQSLSQYYQALADNDANAHGVSIARLYYAEKLAKEANKIANSFPAQPPGNSNLGSDTGSTLLEITKRHLATIQERITEFVKDNDFIYHQPVPAEAALPAVPKLPAAKAISVSELYQGQDIQRIIGPDIFQKIVPMSVTESASLYDEEKAKLIRAETERVETADDEMAASLDYLKLPQSLNVLKGGSDQDMVVDDEFRRWCSELAGHEAFSQAFAQQAEDKNKITKMLDTSVQQLDMEESVCEKMRSKYGVDWTQQPSGTLTSTLRSDIKNYRAAISEASLSDSQLETTFKQNESDFDEMRSAGEADEAEVLYQRALTKAKAAKGKGNAGDEEGSLLDEDYDEAGTSVAEQVASVEELLKKLNLIKRERTQVLKDLKEKIHNDDISQVLILNKKSITNQEAQLFRSELEKFRPYQTRILQANHKQSSVMKDLTRTYGDLLQDKRVRKEQTKYESFSRQRNAVMTKYRRVSQAFQDLTDGLSRARSFYNEMKDTVESLVQNVEEFVGNRKAEGAELLTRIERARANGTPLTSSSHTNNPANAVNTSDNADLQQERLRDLMDRMHVAGPPPPPPPGNRQRPPHRPAPLQNLQQQPPPQYHQPYNPATSPPLSGGFSNTQRPMYSPMHHGFQSPGQPAPSPAYHPHHAHQGSQSSAYNPSTFQSLSPPPNQTRFSGAAQQNPASQQQQRPGQSMPAGYVPPPPPPGPPPGSATGDPWAGLSGWK